MSASSTRLRSTRKFLWSGKGLATILLLFVVWVVVAWFAASSLIVTVPLDRADAIVILSGSATYKERVRKAAELYHAGVSRRIILTNDNRQGGWSRTEERNPFFYERARGELVSAGVSPADVVVLPDPVYSTHDEAVLLRRQKEILGIESMMVVTSAYHSRRAAWVLKQAFGDTPVRIGVNPVAPGYQTPKPATWWLHPKGWEDVPLEYVKLVYYWCLY